MDKKSLDSFEVRTVLDPNPVGGGGRQLHYYSLPRFAEQAGVDIARLPYSLKILLENLLRNEDGVAVKRDDALALAHWDPQAKPITEVAFHPARVVLQDFTGVPRWSIWRRCATPWRPSAATRRASIRSSPRSW